MPHLCLWKEQVPRMAMCTSFKCTQELWIMLVWGGEKKDLGSQVVTELTCSLVAKNHHVYMDNYFSSPIQFEHSEEEGILCCGTVRPYQKGFPPSLKHKRAVKESGDNRILQWGPLASLIWKDKKIVHFLSTNCDPAAMDVTQPWHKDGTPVEINCPSTVANYHKFMNGVDKADQYRMQYATCSSVWVPFLI